MPWHDGHGIRMTCAWRFRAAAAHEIRCKVPAHQGHCGEKVRGPHRECPVEGHSVPLSVSIAQDTITLYQNAKCWLGVALIRCSSGHSNAILCLPLSSPQVCIMDTQHADNAAHRRPDTGNSTRARPILYV